MSSQPHTADAVASYNWADDTDDELDFSAPVFSDDEDLPAELIYPAKPAPAATTDDDGGKASKGGRERLEGAHVSVRERDLSPVTPRQERGGRRESGRRADSRDWERSSSRNNNSYSSSSARQGRGGGGGGGGERVSRSFDNSRLGVRPDHSPSRSQQDRTRSPAAPTGGRQREVIPLPPKPTPDLDANNPTSHVSRSRSPGYRSRSPMEPETNWRRRDNNNNSNDHHPHDPRSLSPSMAHADRRGGSTPRSRSPPHQRRPPANAAPRTHMDQVMSTSPSSRRSQHHHPEDRVNNDRWDKVHVEDKPYPPRKNSPPRRKESERDDPDTVYFMRRDRRPSRDNSAPLSRDREHRHTGMYSEQIEEGQQRQRERRHPPLSQQSPVAAGRHSVDRWEKATEIEPDLPYPERARARSPHSREHQNTMDRDRDHHHPSGRAAHNSPEVRFKGRAAAAAADRDVDLSVPATRDRRERKGSSSTSASDQQSSSSNWWEQSTYSTSKRPVVAVDESSNKSMPKKTAATAPEHEDKGLSSNTARGGPRGRENPADISPRARSSTRRDRGGSDHNAKQSGGGRQSSKDKTPWWEQATYGASSASKEEEKKKKQQQQDSGSGGQSSVPWWEQATYSTKKATTTTSASTANDVATERARYAGSPAGGKGSSTLKNLELLSRGGESTSAFSVKDRKVQESVLEELQAKVVNLDKEFGPVIVGATNKTPAYAAQLEGIVDAFRKLREGLFATETKDAFAARVYEQSVLCSLRAGNVPELIKALHQLVHEIHPAVYPLCSQDLTTLDAWQGAIQHLDERRKEYLGLFILFHLAKSPAVATLDRAWRGAVPVEAGGNLSMLASPKTETDKVIAFLLPLFTRLNSCHSTTSGSKNELSHRVLGAKLVFAMSFWKCLRENDWIGRERLMKQSDVSWMQRLTIQHSIGDGLHASRALTVVAKSKAYYSLSVQAMAQGVGMSVSSTEETVDRLKKSYGLRSNIVVKDDQLMFKAK